MLCIHSYVTFRDTLKLSSDICPNTSDYTSSILSSVKGMAILRVVFRYHTFYQPVD